MKIIGAQMGNVGAVFSVIFSAILYLILSPQAYAAICPPGGEYPVVVQSVENISRCPEDPYVPPPVLHSASFVSQNIPNRMVAGQYYQVSVSMRNNGEITWTNSHSFRLGAQKPNDNYRWGLHRVILPNDVAQGQSVSFSFTVRAPQIAGQYDFQWRMVQDGVTWFGEVTPNIRITVINSTVHGNVDGIAGGVITGWACSIGINQSIDTHVYLGGVAGSSGAVLVGAYRADRPSEPEVAAACQSSGVAHRFEIPIENNWMALHAGKRIYIHAISPVGEQNSAIPGSGSYVVPVNKPPEVSIISPPGGAIFPEGGAAAVHVNATDPDDSVESVSFMLNDVLRHRSSRPYAWTLEGISEGEHNLQVVAADTRGGVTYSPVVKIYGSRVIGEFSLIDSEIVGWACSSYVQSPINVHLYFGGGAGHGNYAGEYRADMISGSSVRASCKSGAAHDFRIAVTDSMIREHGGKKIHLHGISPVNGSDNALSNSGAYFLPANNPPVITLGNPEIIQPVTPGSVRLLADASDTDDDVVLVSFYKNNDKIVDLTSRPFQVTVGDLPAGEHVFYAEAHDRRGGMGTSNQVTIRVTQQQSPVSVTRSYVYDQYQRLCKVVEPEVGVTVIDYDASGNVAWTASGLDQVDLGGCNRNEAYNSGRRVDRRYDASGRILSISHPDGNGDQHFEYNIDGSVRAVDTINEGGAVSVRNSYEYNNRGLIKSDSSVVSSGQQWIFNYSYDSEANLVSLIYPSGLEVAYTNTAHGYPLHVSANGHVYASDVSYHPNGQVHSFSYGNGVRHVTNLNARNLHRQVVDAGVIGYEYSYNGNASVTSIKDINSGPGFDRNMEYDVNDRLVAVRSGAFGPGEWLRYSYDDRDNITSIQRDGVSRSEYWYDSRNRLANIRDSNNSTIAGFAYDHQGNLKNKNGRLYEFDFGNRLLSVTGIESYSYDGYGRRVLASGYTGVRVRSHYDSSGRILYENRLGEGDIEYVYFGSRLLAVRRNGVDHYQHLDVLGSPVAVTNAYGQVVERTNYEPYGQSIGKRMDGVGYGGHVVDGSTDLVYMQQRYYDAEVGRFLSADPVSADSNPSRSFNRYRYADNNPYKYVDPDGRQSVGYLQDGVPRNLTDLYYVYVADRATSPVSTEGSDSYLGNVFRSVSLTASGTGAAVVGGELSYSKNLHSGEAEVLASPVAGLGLATAGGLEFDLLTFKLPSAISTPISIQRSSETKTVEGRFGAVGMLGVKANFDPGGELKIQGFIGLGAGGRVSLKSSGVNYQLWSNKN